LIQKLNFRYEGTSSEYLGQVHISRSSGQGHRKKTCLCVLFTGGMLSTVRWRRY